MPDHSGPPRPDSSSKLDAALSNITAQEMKAVREEVQGQLTELGNNPIIPIPSPRTSIRVMAHEPAPETTRSSNIEDLQEAGKIAKDFLTGMDRITDVLMLLVLKFGRASTLMRGVLIGNLIALTLLAASIVALWNLSGSLTVLQQEQEKIQRQQALILVTAGQAKEKAEAAEQKASEVQQKAPEVVVGANGRPQLILKVQNPEEGQDTTKVVNPPKKSKIKDGNGDGQTLEVPLPF